MITESELRKLQKLAKLSFSKEELADFSKKLNSVIEMIDSLVAVDCTGIEPLSSVCDMKQRTREDEVTAGNITEQLLANVPERNADFAREVKCFIVPKVIE